jgi:hypothetical protein
MIFITQRLLDLCRWRNYSASKHQELLTQWLNVTSKKTRIHTKVTWWKVQTVWGMIQHLEAQVSPNIMDKGAIYRQVLSPYMITPLWTSQDTFMQWTHKGIRGFHIITVVCFIDETQHQGTEGQFICPVWTNSALGIPAFNCVTLLPFALICPFCCTASGWMPVRQAHSHIFTCYRLYSLQPLGFISMTLIKQDCKQHTAMAFFSVAASSYRLNFQFLAFREADSVTCQHGNTTQWLSLPLY